MDVLHEPYRKDLTYVWGSIFFQSLFFSSTSMVFGMHFEVLGSYWLVDLTKEDSCSTFVMV